MTEYGDQFDAETIEMMKEKGITEISEVSKAAMISAGVFEHCNALVEKLKKVDG